MAERSFPALDTHELAWAAGFFDGEGNIRAKLNKQNPMIYCHPVIFMPQIDPQVLERFRRAVAEIGKVTGPFDRSRYGGDRQPQWYYEVYSFERVQAVIALLWTWLSPVKREQASSVFMKVREGPQPNPKLLTTCSAVDCSGYVNARGLCRSHYLRWQRARRAGSLT